MRNEKHLAAKGGFPLAEMIRLLEKHIPNKDICMQIAQMAMFLEIFSGRQWTEGITKFSDGICF